MQVLTRMQAQLIRLNQKVATLTLTLNLSLTLTLTLTLALALALTLTLTLTLTRSPPCLPLLTARGRWWSCTATRCAAPHSRY